MNQTTVRTCPRAPADAAVSPASTPATSGSGPRSCDSRRTDRTECRPVPAGSESKIHPSTGPDCIARHWGHFPHAASASLLATTDSPAAPLLPIHTQPCVMCYGALHDQGLDPFRMRQDHAKTHRTAVILHV